MSQPPRILIIGGGHVGLNVALRLCRSLSTGEAGVVLAEPRSYLTYHPLLAEAATGNVEPRHMAGEVHRPRELFERIAEEEDAAATSAGAAARRRS